MTYKTEIQSNAFSHRIPNTHMDFPSREDRSTMEVRPSSPPLSPRLRPQAKQNITSHKNRKGPLLVRIYSSSLDADSAASTNQQALIYRFDEMRRKRVRKDAAVKRSQAF